MLYYEIFFLCFYDCLVEHVDILFNFFLLKIDLIWWDKFSCNFKYIFINEIGFIKEIILVVEQINKKYSFTGWGGASQGPKGMEQDKILRGGAQDPILWTRLASLSSLVMNQICSLLLF